MVALKLHPPPVCFSKMLEMEDGVFCCTGIGVLAAFVAADSQNLRNWRAMRCGQKRHSNGLLLQSACPQAPADDSGSHVGLEGGPSDRVLDAKALKVSSSAHVVPSSSGMGMVSFSSAAESIPVLVEDEEGLKDLDNPSCDLDQLEESPDGAPSAEHCLEFVVDDSTPNSIARISRKYSWLISGHIVPTNVSPRDFLIGSQLGKDQVGFQDDLNSAPLACCMVADPQEKVADQMHSPEGCPVIESAQSHVVSDAAEVGSDPLSRAIQMLTKDEALHLTLNALVPDHGNRLHTHVDGLIFRKGDATLGIGESSAAQVGPSWRLDQETGHGYGDVTHVVQSILEDGGLATALESLPSHSHQHIGHLSGECAARGSEAAKLMGVDVGKDLENLSCVHQYEVAPNLASCPIGRKRVGLPCGHQEAAGTASSSFTSSGAKVADHDSIVPPFEEVELKMAKIEAPIAAREASPNSASRISFDVERLHRKLVELKAQRCLTLSPTQMPYCPQAAHGYVPEEAPTGNEAADLETKFRDDAEHPTYFQGPSLELDEDALFAKQALGPGMSFGGGMLYLVILLAKPAYFSTKGRGKFRVAFGWFSFELNGCATVKTGVFNCVHP
ncbi:hypothetical protein Nepgr_029707 [Nepenthes gracilis]|uniref:Uncharacterized protein n=1 Tax=Nepenthes gracilis TaxID=150966 RepID=A0AAD3TET8_NEPGR|nr:hypothetical protein Nepgr_029707 [Nepenthes gracilis]